MVEGGVKKESDGLLFVDFWIGALGKRMYRMSCGM